MFSKLVALAAYASTAVCAVVSPQMPMVMSCSLTTESSSPVVHALDAGYYTIYNKATGTDRLASFNKDSPVLVLPGNVPKAYRTWKIVPTERESEYFITNVGLETTGKLEDDVVITAAGHSTSVTIKSTGDKEYMIQVHVSGEYHDQVWQVCDDDQGLSTWASLRAIASSTCRHEDHCDVLPLRRCIRIYACHRAAASFYYEDLLSPSPLSVLLAPGLSVLLFVWCARGNA
ncbi:hypothetical protein B0H19DRAFT_1271609 [Mycena capillaripes]|nr:hypothetical protein B0H19DRAFT_1271609 [Mycena capillaripes]